MRRAFRAAVDITLVAVVAIALAGAIGSRAIVTAGRTPVVIAGGSMEPTIGIGSLAVVAPAPIGELRPGDVTLVRTAPDRAPFTHRITRVVEREGGTWLELRGDANAAPDAALVPATAVVGRVVAVVPHAGRLVAALSTGGGLLAVVGLAGILYTLSLALEPSAAASVVRQTALRGSSEARTPAPAA
jgi:signal peptidase